MLVKSLHGVCQYHIFLISQHLLWTSEQGARNSKWWIILLGIRKKVVKANSKMKEWKEEVESLWIKRIQWLCCQRKYNHICFWCIVCLVWSPFACILLVITVVASGIHLCSNVRVYSWPYLFLDHQLSGVDCSLVCVVFCPSCHGRNGPI